MALWLARDNIGTVLHRCHPRMNRHRNWLNVSGRFDDDYICLTGHEEFPLVKPGECIKVKLVRDDE